MNRASQATVLACLAALAGCGGDDGASVTGPEITYANLAGTYAGALGGVAQGVSLTATFTVTLTQSSGSLSGSYSIAGTLDDGVIQVSTQGTGTLTGTVASGNNPSVNLTLRTGFCPNYTAAFSGAYDSANRLLTLSGPVDILDGNCAVFLSYQSTIILSN